MAMSGFESCRKQTEKPRRTASSILQPTIGHEQFAKNVPKHRCSCPLYANLSERLHDVDLTQHYACVWPKATTHIQDAPDNIPQHATQLYGGGLREIRVSVDATCILRRQKREIVDNPSFGRRHHHGQRRQSQIGDGVRFCLLYTSPSPRD